jgi:hypothetical protein
MKLFSALIFWLGIVTKPVLSYSSLKSVMKAHISKPFPIKTISFFIPILLFNPLDFNLNIKDEFVCHADSTGKV